MTLLPFFVPGDETSVCALFLVHIGEDLKRWMRLVRREGLGAACRKGVRYLRWKIPAETRRFFMLRLRRPEDRFTMIYRTNMWAAKESRSGPAASLEGTRNLRRTLPALLGRLRVRTLLDAPCGDFYWMQHVVRVCPVTYIGGDIVRPLIEANNERFGDATRRFVHIDVTRDRIPRTDLWLCRGLLSLLSLDDGIAVLRRFVESGTPYILLSSHKNPERRPNIDIASGDFREVDLFSAPFNLPPPLQRLDDRWDEDLCLWSRAQVEDALADGAGRRVASTA